MAASSNIFMDGRVRSIREAIARDKRPPRAISDEEIDIFADLLAKLLRYIPKERISPKQALEHDWFKSREVVKGEVK